MSLVNREKYVSSLPGALKNSTIYFVKQGSAFDLYVTNETGTPVVYGLRNTLLTGNAGGQSITGGLGAGENLTLVSTSDPAKGKIYLGAAQQKLF
jgi:hypothetical protein